MDHFDELDDDEPPIWLEPPGPLWQRKDTGCGLTFTVCQLDDAWTWLVTNVGGDVFAHAKGLASAEDAMDQADEAV